MMVHLYYSELECSSKKKMCSDSKGPLSHMGPIGRIQVAERMHIVSLKQSKTMYLCVYTDTHTHSWNYMMSDVRFKLKDLEWHIQTSYKKGVGWGEGPQEAEENFNFIFSYIFIYFYIIYIFLNWTFYNWNIFIYYLSKK